MPTTRLTFAAASAIRGSSTAVAVGVIQVFTAGCSSSESAPELETLPPASATAPNASTPQQSQRPIFDGTEREWLYAYAGCMEDAASL